jgi:Flp pilus assembly protein TadD
VNILPDGLLSIDAEVTRYYGYVNVASEALDKGDNETAIREFKKALATHPDEPILLNSLGAALAQQGSMEEAISDMQRAVEAEPDYVTAYLNLGLALSRVGRLNEAVAHTEQAVRLSGGQDPRVLGFLGELYAKAGRVAEAIEVTRHALALAAQSNDHELVQDLKSHLAVYEPAR